MSSIVFFFFGSMYNKTIIRFGFCDIQNNQGLGKGYQPQPSVSADNPYLDLDYSGYHPIIVYYRLRGGGFWERIFGSFRVTEKGISHNSKRKEGLPNVSHAHTDLVDCYLAL